MRIPAMLSAALLLLPPGAALAHARLVKADPAVGSSVDKAPSQLRLRFNEVIRPAASGVRLTWPDGHSAVLNLAKDAENPETVIAAAPGVLPPGPYKVEWRALSPDGHHTQGDYGFTIRP